MAAGGGACSLTTVHCGATDLDAVGAYDLWATPTSGRALLAFGSHGHAKGPIKFALDQETLSDRHFGRSDPRPTLPEDPRPDGLEVEVRAILPVGSKCWV